MMNLYSFIIEFINLGQVLLPVKLDLEIYNKRKMKLVDEVKIFEDISRFIQIFNKGLTFLQLIIQNANNNDQLRVYIQKQKNTLAELLLLAQKYGYQTEYLNIDQNTYLRFCNRLIETISLMKTQQLHANNLEFDQYFAQNLKNLEKIVKKNQQQRRFRQLIADTYWLFLSFCSKLEGHFFMEQIVTYTNSCEKLKQRGLQVMANKKMPNLKRNEDSVFYRIKNDSLQKITKNQPKTQVSKINKIISNINYRYDTLKCLDIDYQYFKSSTFQAIQKAAVFQSQYLNRNQDSIRFLKLYQDDFCLFLKKKQLKINSKIKKLNLQTEYGCLGSIKSVFQEAKQRKNYIKLIRDKINQTLNQKSLVDKLSKSKDEQIFRNNQLEKIFTNQSNKTLYNPKINYFIFGKKQNKNVDNLARKDEKKSQKKVLQTHPINLSIFRDDIYENTNQQSEKPLKEQKQVKIQLENPLMLRFQQQIMQIPKEQSQKQQKKSYVLSNTKKIVKSKEVQFDFVKTITEADQTQNFVFKERVLKYRTKIEPKLRNIIFRSKQI